mgnify:CR=1 FL=1
MIFCCPGASEIRQKLRGSVSIRMKEVNMKEYSVLRAVSEEN